MQMCFPTIPDYQYPTMLTLQYLLSLPPVPTGQFDVRYFYTFNMDIQTIKTPVQAPVYLLNF
jgi:hypothetical protein